MEISEQQEPELKSAMRLPLTLILLLMASNCPVVEWVIDILYLQLNAWNA